MTRRSDSPTVAVVTMASWGPVYPRIARWLGAGLAEIGARADVVFIDRPVAARSPTGGPGAGSAPADVREVALGVGHVRWCLPALAAYMAARTPAITVATPGAIGTAALLAGRVVGLDVVPWISTIPRLDRADISALPRCAEMLSGRVHRRAGRIAAVSAGVRDALVSAFGPRLPSGGIVVLPNPADASEIRRSSMPHAGRNGRLRLCAVGRLVRAKGFDVLVDALSVAHLGRHWELLIIGEGPMRASLEHRIGARGLGDHVRLLGSLDNPYPVLASADIALSASRWEGFGVVVLEALALGVPQVATTCPGGVAEILGDGTYGVLVPPDDPVALAEGLGALADDRQRRADLAAKGRHRVTSYAPRIIAEQVFGMVKGMA